MKKRTYTIIVIFTFLLVGGYIFFNKFKPKTFDVIKSYQYLAINNGETINIEFTFVDYSTIFKEPNDIHISLIDNENVELSLNTYNIYNLQEDYQSDYYTVYKLVAEVNESHISNTLTQYKKIKIRTNTKTYIRTIGSVNIEKVSNITVDSNDINIMATLFSIDGESFNLVVENSTNFEITISDIYYDIFYKNQSYCSPKKQFIIAKNSTQNCDCNINSDLKEVHIIIRPIIEYNYKNKVYKVLSHSPIYFNNNVTKEEIERISN